MIVYFIEMLILTFILVHKTFCKVPCTFSGSHAVCVHPLLTRLVSGNCYVAVNLDLAEYCSNCTSS